MSLLTNNMEPVIKLLRASASDGMGGTETKEWRDGCGFLAAIVPDVSTEVEVANKKHTKNQYIVITERGALLRHHDVIRRERDGKIFRITSDAIETSPKSAALALEKVTAEEWSLA